MNGPTHRRTLFVFLALALVVFSLAACLNYESGKETGEALRDLDDSTGEFVEGVRDGYGGDPCPAGLAPGLLLFVGIGLQNRRKG